MEAHPHTVHKAVHDTWVDVAERRLPGLDGQERWRGEAGEAGFWRCFLQTVFTRAGGGPLPPGLLRVLILHFQDERHWTVYDDVFAVLEELSLRGLRLVVVSNWDSTLPALLKRLRLTTHFHAVVVSALVGRSKPAPEIFQEALRVADVRPEEALHVGDSPDDDYHGARAAGIRALLLDRANRASSGYDRIRSLAEIPALLGSDET